MVITQNLVIYEDRKVSDLGSIVLMRPCFDLLCGMTSLREKLLRNYNEANVTFALREYLHDVYREQLAEENAQAQVTSLENAVMSGLFLNGRTLVLSSDSLPSIEGSNEVGYVRVERKNAKTKEVMERGEELVYLRTDGANLELIKQVLSGENASFKEVLESAGYKIREIREGVVMIKYPWDLIINNSNAIRSDFEKFGGTNQFHGCVKGVFFVHLEEDEKHKKYQASLSLAEIEMIKEMVESDKVIEVPVHVGKDSWIDPGIVIDTTEGPVYIGDDVKITQPSRIAGPCYIGDKTIIDGAKLKEGNSIGPVCRIGGEVEGSIIQGYSNKHHDGFLGHAFVGEWVNIGALATNSDLKNNYGTVRVTLSPGRTIDSGEYKTVGVYIGDHTKIGILVPLNTGTHIGVACNLFGGMPPKYVPSFSWGGEVLSLYDFDKMLDTAVTVMGRRDKSPSEAYKALLAHIRELTEQERKSVGAMR